MTRQIELNRDEAELLVDVLETNYQTKAITPYGVGADVAAMIRTAFGMPPQTELDLDDGSDIDGSDEDGLDIYLTASERAAIQCEANKNQRALMDSIESIEVNVTPTTEGDINLDVDLVSGDVREAISREIIKTKEEQTRKALIALGWTPPDGDAPIVADKAMLIDAIIGRGFASAEQSDAALKFSYSKVVAGIMQWDRTALSLLNMRKLLGIYTTGM